MVDVIAYGRSGSVLLRELVPSAVTAEIRDMLAARMGGGSSRLAIRLTGLSLRSYAGGVAAFAYSGAP